MDVIRAGSDVLLLTVGPAIGLAEEAAAPSVELGGVQASVAAVTRLHPLDVDSLAPASCGTSWLS